MTLAEGKRKVLMLLDEYSSGGTLTTDNDINNKMADFFDMAQKDVAKVKPIYKEISYNMTETGEQMLKLPGDCACVFRIWADGVLTRRVVQRGNFLAVPPAMGETLLVEYRAVPATIGRDTPEDYEFEVCEEAAACMPFYVASMQLIPDLVVDYGSFWNIYQNMLAMLDTKEPSSGTSMVHQTLFSGGKRR